MDPELKALLEAAEAKLKSVESTNGELKTANENLKGELKTLKDTVSGLDTGNKSAVEEMKNEIADLEEKIKSFNSGVVASTKEQKEQVVLAIKTGIARHIRAKCGEKLDSDRAKGLVIDDQYAKSSEHAAELMIKALNLTNTGEGAESVDTVLSREIIERAREAYPIINLVRWRSMPRDLREEVLISYPTVEEGIENVAGVVLAETATQTYAEVRNRVFKLHAKPRITDEAMYGSDLALYEHLLTLLTDEFGRRLAMQIYYGDGTGKNARGLLSSNRIDFTDVTGQSFKETIHATDARSADIFPVMATGVAGGLPATDKEIVDMLIDVTTALPTAYLNQARWVMNRRTLGRLKKVRDANDTPIFMASYMGNQASLLGFPLTIDDYAPDFNADGAPFAIFGDIAQAISISEGDIDKTLIDPYTVDGCTVIKKDKEYFEMVGKNDAIVVVVATANDTVV